MISVAFMKGYDGLRFRVQDIDNETYYQLPKGLFSYRFYAGLDIKAKVLYAVLKDRMNLSRRNGWIEENGDIFLMFSYGDLAVLLGMSKTAICRAFKKLVEYGLIETVTISRSGAQKIYINRIEPPESMADVHDYEDRLGRAEIEAMEDAAKGMVVDAHAAGFSLTMKAAREKVLSRLKENRSAGGTACSVLETPRCASETPCSVGGTTCSADETACSADGTAPVPPAELSKTDIYNKTDIERQKREKNTTTTTTGVAQANDPLQEIISSYRENISPMVGPVVTNELARLCQEYGKEQVNDSITEAALSAKREVSVKYLRAILNRWSMEGKEKTTRAITMNEKPAAVNTASEPNEAYDDDGKPLPRPLPGENAKEYFNRVGISV